MWPMYFSSKNHSHPKSFDLNNRVTGGSDHIFRNICPIFFDYFWNFQKRNICPFEEENPSEKLKNPFFSACGASKTVFSSFPTSKTFLRVFLLQLWWKGSISAPSIHEERCFCALESQHESGIYEPPKSIIFEIFKNGIYAKRNIWSPSAVVDLELQNRS